MSTQLWKIIAEKNQRIAQLEAQLSAKEAELRAEHSRLPRVYIKLHQKIYDVHTIAYGDGYVTYIDTGMTICARMNDCVLIFPTGKKDSNGVPIYQDDEVMFNYEQLLGTDVECGGIVEYHEADAAWYIQLNVRGCAIHLADPNIHDLQVVGSNAGED